MLRAAACRCLRKAKRAMRRVVAAIAAISTSGAVPTIAGRLWCSLTQKRA